MALVFCLSCSLALALLPSLASANASQFTGVAAPADDATATVAPGTAVMSLPDVDANIGQTLTVKVSVDTPASRGAEFGISFDPSVLSCNSVVVGSFYSSWATAQGGSTLVLPQGTCDNTDGLVTDTGMFIEGAGEAGPSGQGVIATVSFTALANGTSPLMLQDAVVSGANSATVHDLPTLTVNGQVIVGPTPVPTATFTPTPTPVPTATETPTPSPSPTSSDTPTPGPSPTAEPSPMGFVGSPYCDRADVNGDGRVDATDLALVGLFWGERGTPGWIPEDVFPDGFIDVTDLSVVGLCWGPAVTMGATPEPTPTPTLTPTPTATPTPTPMPTATPAPTFSAGSPTDTPTSGGYPTDTPEPTGTPVPLPPSDSRYSVVPAQLNVAPGATFSLAVDLEADRPIRAGSIDLAFDPAVLQCTKAAEGTLLSSWAQANGGSTFVFPLAACDNTAGTASIGISILGAVSDPADPGGATGTGSILLLTFKAQTAGTSAITLTDYVLADQHGNKVGAGLDNGQVVVGSVASTPDPSGTPGSGTPIPTPNATATPTPTPHAGTGSTHRVYLPLVKENRPSTGARHSAAHTLAPAKAMDRPPTGVVAPPTPSRRATGTPQPRTSPLPLLERAITSTIATSGADPLRRLARP